jgi:hypothetical protein
MGHFPLLDDFLEEQLWALRDRAEAIESASLPESIAVKLAVVTDEISEAALLLRRPTRTNRDAVCALVTQLRRMLETIERDAWSDPPPD